MEREASVAPSLGPGTELLCPRTSSQPGLVIRDSRGWTWLEAGRGRVGGGGGGAQGNLLLPPLRLALSPAQSNSGSSLVCQVNHTWVQMGVVSWMFSCNQHSFPTLYTSTAYFTHWIKRRVAEVRFVSRAPPAFPSPVFLTGYTLLVSLGSLWLL